ncbi:MAG TPA: glycoside hydrolase family 88 protein [Bacteroidales bacterium]|jgi:rhamnogalacturonyl hydrolase YesR|nr:glycoside hydrolase family 88 protein [Bacteroidales bacterium]
MNDVLTDTVRNSFEKLSVWCENEGYRGYDPYDGLNSKIFRSVPLLSHNRYARLAWIQLFKRSPLNLRPLTGVQKGYNPKALGLFLSGYCRLYKYGGEARYLEKIHFFTEKILELASNSWSGASWGYNFDWQARAFFQPENTPTVVATTFTGCSLIDAYEITGDERLLQTARSACDFILEDLNRTSDRNGNFAFSYSPLDNSVVYNASLLGSRMLARVYNHTGEQHLAETALRSVRYCCDNQNEDGSWSYGKASFHKWIDNFHTGYNLECLADYARYTGDHSFDYYLEKGLNYYFRTFFTAEGIPKYYNNSIYPVDIHSSAQIIITAVKTNRFREKQELLERVMQWTIENMQSEKGYFYYQINRYFSSRIPYMRWAQAWMFYSMSMYIYHAAGCR